MHGCAIHPRQGPEHPAHVTRPQVRATTALDYIPAHGQYVSVHKDNRGGGVVRSLIAAKHCDGEDWVMRSSSMFHPGRLLSGRLEGRKWKDR